MRNTDGQEVTCPKCDSTDITAEKITLRIQIPLSHIAKALDVSIGHKDHKDFPILRCANCGNVALSEEDLIKIIPEIAGNRIEFVQLPEKFHELN